MLTGRHDQHDIGLRRHRRGVCLRVARESSLIARTGLHDDAFVTSKRQRSPLTPKFHGDSSLITRYGGSSLGRDPRIAVVTNVPWATLLQLHTLLQMLREGMAVYARLLRWNSCHPVGTSLGLSRHPCCASRHVTTGTGNQPAPYDLVVNVERGAWDNAQPPFAGTSGSYAVVSIMKVAPKCLSETPAAIYGATRTVDQLTQRYDFLTRVLSVKFCAIGLSRWPGSGYRLAREALAKYDIPDVILSITAVCRTSCGLSAVESTVNHLTAGGLKRRSGAKPVDQQILARGDDESALIAAGVIDLRGLFSLPQVVSVLDAARLVLSSTVLSIRMRDRYASCRIVPQWHPPFVGTAAAQFARHEPGDDGRVDIEHSMERRGFLPGTSTRVAPTTDMLSAYRYLEVAIATDSCRLVAALS